MNAEMKVFFTANMFNLNFYIVKMAFAVGEIAICMFQKVGKHVLHVCNHF